MKSIIFIAATLTSFTCAFADNVPFPKAEDINVSAVVIKAKAEAISAALVQLKLKEVELVLAEPVDHQKIDIVRSQQAALNKELAGMEAAQLKVRLQELELRLQEQLKLVKENNPKVLDTKGEIINCKTQIARIEGGKPAALK